MIHIVILLCISLVSPVTLAVGAIPNESANSPTVEVTQPLHFLSSTDEDIIVPPGSYQVEAADAWLKLLPVGGERNEATLIQAIPGDHQDEVTAPHAILGPTEENPDLHYLVLLLPEE